MKPVVLFVVDTLEVGGSERSILAIASRLHRFTAVVCTIYRGDALVPEFEKAGIRIVRLQLAGRYNFVAAVRAFRQVLKDVDPAVVHATLFRSEVVSRWCLRNTRIPLLGSFVNDSYSPERFAELSLPMRLKLQGVRWVDRFTARWCTHFVANTQAIGHSNAAALRVAPDKIEVIYRGREIQAPITLAAAVVSGWRGQFGGSFYFLSVARLLKRKGLHESIEAFVRIAEAHPQARYLIAGEGHDRPLLETLIRRFSLQDKIFLLGTRHDIPELLAFAQVFVFPSHYEGQGGALIEAMLAGKFILASNIPANCETVTEGVSARLFQLHDVTDLSEKMVMAINDFSDCARFGELARQEAIRKFDVALTARRHEDVYARLAGLI